MGAHFVNFQVRSDSMERVTEAMQRRDASSAYISPELNGWVSIYEGNSESQDDQIIKTLGTTLSTDLQTAVIAFLIHDSSVLYYWLFEDGTLIDQYVSIPDYFGPVPDAEKLAARGEAGKLLRHCAPGTDIAQIEQLLHPEDMVVFAEETLEELAGLLGIAAGRVMLGHRYFAEEASELLDDAQEFVELRDGNVRAVKLARPEPLPIAGEVPQYDAYVMALWVMVCAIHPPVPMPDFESLAATMVDGDDLEKWKKQLQRTLRKQTVSTVTKLLAQSERSDLPSFEELDTAASEGLDALCHFVATRTPDAIQPLKEMAVRSKHLVLQQALERAS